MSCCNGTTIRIHNATQATLAIKSITPGRGTKVNGLSVGDTVGSGGVRSFTASSASGTNGQAMGTIGVTIGTEPYPVYLNYQLTPKDDFGGCPCVPTGLASPPAHGHVEIRVQGQNGDKDGQATLDFWFDPSGAPPRNVIIVGAGAAGVFTAYQIATVAPKTRITLLEARDRVGGNVESIQVTQGGATAWVDAGAQFFSPQAQPTYVSLLQKLGLEDAVFTAPAGVTVWDQVSGTLTFKIPTTWSALLLEVLANPGAWLDFGLFIYYAWRLDKKGPSDQTTVADWVNGLDVISDTFKQQVILPFLYQFDTVDPSVLGGCNAWYTVTYLARSLTLSDQGLFLVMNCKNGLQWVLEQVLQAAGQAAAVDVHLSTPVKEVEWTGDQWKVQTPSGELSADALVFAIDGSEAGLMLPSSYDPTLTSLLKGLPFARLPIDMQQGGSCYMPGKKDDWEAVNILTSQTKSGETQYLFTVYFGALQTSVGNPPAPLSVFKSWGNPDFDPSACPQYPLHGSQRADIQHPIMVPTLAFLQARDQIAGYQGANGLWFAGAWTNWFDSQESALQSAMGIAAKMFLNAAPASASPAPSYAAHADALYERILKLALEALEDESARDAYATAVASLRDELRD